MSDADLVAALDEIEHYIGRFVIMSDRQRAAVTLWVFHTWAFEAAGTTPYLNVSSPTKQCGKTRLFEVLELLVRRPAFGANHTESTLFRTIDAKEPTLLLDEIDRTFGKDAKLYAGILGVLNSGYRAGATIPRNVGEGASMKVKDFKTFCPKAFAGIGALPDTVADRSIPIRLQRRGRTESVERFRERRERAFAEPIRARLEQLAAAQFDALDQAEPALPDALSDRQQGVWEPLLAIADLAGSGWEGRARLAAVGLHEAPEEHDTIRLLDEMRAIFDGHKAVPTQELIRGLVDIEDAPYAIWWAKQVAEADASPDKSSGLWKSLGAKLARELHEFGVKPGMAFDGERSFRGYERADLEPLWERYLPAIPSEDAEDADDAEPGQAQARADSASSASSASFAYGQEEMCPECGALSAERGYSGHAAGCPRFYAKEAP